MSKQGGMAYSLAKEKNRQKYDMLVRVNGLMHFKVSTK